MIVNFDVNHDKIETQFNVKHDIQLKKTITVQRVRNLKD
jgi:hypothetical protein